jgi:hypothetical protein
MKDSVIGWRGGVGSVAVLALLCAPAGWASGTACATGNTTITEGTNTVPIPQSNANGNRTSSELASNVTAGGTGFTSGNLTAGCFQVDQSFGNFAVGGGTGSGTQSTADTYMYTTSGGAAQAIVFSDIADSANKSTNDTAVDYETNIHENGDAVTFQFVFYSNLGTSGTPNALAANEALAAIAIQLEGVTLAAGTGNNIEVSAVGCTSATNTLAVATNNGGLFTACAGTGNPGGSSLTSIPLTFTSANITGGAGGTLPLGSLFSSSLAGIDQVALDISVTIDATGANNNEFTDLEVEFNTPEPSTFVLLGTALAVIGLLRLRARRRLSD